MSGRWHGKPLQPAELAIILEQRALGHGKELIKRALAREGYQRSTESIRGHLESIKRREEAAAMRRTVPLSLAAASQPAVPQGWAFSVSDDDDGTWLRVKSPGGREAAFSAVNGGLAHDNRRSIASRVLLELKEALATTPAPAPAVPSVQQGWVEQMLTDLRHVFDAGGVETPQETRDVIEYAASWIAAYRDNLAATPTTPAPVVAGTRIESGVMIMKDGKAWGVAYSDGQTTAYGWVTPEQATIHDPKHLVKPTDATWQGSGYADELRKGKIVHVERRTQVIVKEQP